MDLFSNIIRYIVLLFAINIFGAAYASQKGTADWMARMSHLTDEQRTQAISDFYVSQRRSHDFRKNWDMLHPKPFLTAEQWEAIPKDMHVGICIASKDDNVFIREWAEYYIRVMGVNRIYLYDDGSSVPLNLTILDWIQRGNVEYEYVPPELRPIQTRGYHSCFERHAAKHRFLVGLDTDEFLAIPKANSADPHPFATLMQKHARTGALHIWWIVIGNDGYKTRPAAGVPASYQGCAAVHGLRWKPVCNTKYTTRMGNFTASQLPVFNENDTLPYTMHECMIDPSLESNSDMETPAISTLRSGQVRVKLGSTRRAVQNLLGGDAVLFHYALKSEEDYAIKTARGGGTGRKYYREASYFDKVMTAVKRTATNCTEVKDLIARLGFGTSAPDSPPTCLIGRPPATYGSVACVPQSP